MHGLRSNIRALCLIGRILWSLGVRLAGKAVQLSGSMLVMTVNSVIISDGSQEDIIQVAYLICTLT